MKAERKNVPMPTRYCTVDQKPIPPDRVAKHSPFCSVECARQHKNDMRSVMAGKKCRLCKRVFPKPRKAKVEDEAPELFPAGAPGAQNTSEASTAQV